MIKITFRGQSFDGRLRSFEISSASGDQKIYFVLDGGAELNLPIPKNQDNDKFLGLIKTIGREGCKDAVINFDTGKCSVDRTTASDAPASAPSPRRN